MCAQFERYGFMYSPCNHVSKCTPNYSRWPFDRQNCTIHIGTWVDSGDEIDFKLMKTVVTDDDLSSQNSEWRLIQATYKRDAGNYTNTKVTYPSLTFSFLIERHSGTYAVHVLVPAIGMHSVLDKSPSVEHCEHWSEPEIEILF